MLIKIPFQKNLLYPLNYEWTLHVRTGHGAQNMIEDPLGVPNVLVRVPQELVLRSKDAVVMLFFSFTGQLVMLCHVMPCYVMLCHVIL